MLHSPVAVVPELKFHQQDASSDSVLHPLKYLSEPPALVAEIRNWFNPINMLVYLWPVARLHNRLFMRHSFFRKANRLPHFAALWETIRKGSFAYNTFLFKKPSVGKNLSRSRLADLTCLALLFGDEFIDGICQHLGKQNVRQVLKTGQHQFYLQIARQKNDLPALQYAFDLYELLPEEIWAQHNEKYRITYAQFYELLKELLELMNRQLEKLKSAVAWTTAAKIKEACDTCFDTFLHDVHDVPVQLGYCSGRPIINWHEKKNRCIQKKLLELRATLLQQNLANADSAVAGWLDIITTMQVYDDMQDSRQDALYQDNLLLAFASARFPQELEWFHQHRQKFYDDAYWRLLVSQHMPGSVYCCMRFTKDCMMKNMNWVQKKICNYIWKQNWFRPGKSWEKIKKENLNERFSHLMQKTRTVRNLTGSETEWKAFTLESAFHDRRLRQFILSEAGWRNRYFLYFNFLQYSSAQKAKLADKILAGING
jgi:hypothetical protein